MATVGELCNIHDTWVTQRSWDAWHEMCNKYGGLAMLDTCLCQAEQRYNSRWYVGLLEEDRKQLIMDKIEEERVKMRIEETLRKNKVKEMKDSRWYLITFTNKPTEFDPHDLIKRTLKVVKSKMVSPIQWAYSIEIQPGTGTPHTHIVLETNKYFDYNKIMNFNGGRQAKVDNEKWNVKKYVVKDETKPSKEWLEKYGLTQWFFCSDDYAGPRPDENSEIISNTISWA